MQQQLINNIIPSKTKLPYKSNDELSYKTMFTNTTSNIGDTDYNHSNDYNYDILGNLEGKSGAGYIETGIGSYNYNNKPHAISSAGGIATELGGGKFANGARTAAFVHLFNHENIMECAMGSCHRNNIPSEHRHLTDNERLVLSAPAYAVGGGMYVAGAKGLVNLGRYAPTVFDRIRTWWYSGVASGLTVMSNPAIIQRGVDFVDGYSLEGPPQPSPGGYAGAYINKMQDYINK